MANVLKLAGRMVDGGIKAVDAGMDGLDAIMKHLPAVIDNVGQAVQDATEAAQQYCASLPITTYRSTYQDILETYGDDVANEYLSRIGKPAVPKTETKPETKSKTKPEQLKL